MGVIYTPTLREAISEFAQAHAGLAHLEEMGAGWLARRTAREQVDTARRRVVEAHERAQEPRGSQDRAEGPDGCSAIGSADSGAPPGNVG